MSDIGSIKELPDYQPLCYYQYRAFQLLNPYPKGNVIFFEWLNEFEFVADLISVPEHYMVQFFQSMVENGIHIYIKTKYPDVDYFNCSYKEIINIFHYLFDSIDNEREAYRKRFVRRYQFEEETIEKYAASLEELYDKCSYTVTAASKNKKMCSQFIKGIRDNEIRLLSQNYPLLNFDAVSSLAIELANKNY